MGRGGFSLPPRGRLKSPLPWLSDAAFRPRNAEMMIFVAFYRGLVYKRQTEGKILRARLGIGEIQTRRDRR